jgi:hypothetical protein
MTTEDVLFEMQQKVPDFHLDAEWLTGKLTYPAFNDLARFMCTAAGNCQWGQVDNSVAFLEAAVKDGNSEVQDLVRECLETLAECEWVNSLKTHFGEGLHAIWTIHSLEWDSVETQGCAPSQSSRTDPPKQP